MEKENKMDFRAETVAEEYAELVGRMKAFEAYLRTTSTSLLSKKCMRSYARTGFRGRRVRKPCGY